MEFGGGRWERLEFCSMGPSRAADTLAVSQIIIVCTC